MQEMIFSKSRYRTPVYEAHFAFHANISLKFACSMTLGFQPIQNRARKSYIAFTIMKQQE